ncbi:hypothetical protein ABTY00_24315 [Streptomyces microflavus]|uniref:WDGH domain-containing protein n=1 Tax=Streptomyces microflavus TaxID=1919 RepID=UPI003333BA83
MADIDPLSAVYRERAHLVAHLAAVYPAAIGTDPNEPDWPVLFIETDAGQLSWHIAPDDVPLFAHVPRSDSSVWDGHTTEQKYARLDNLTRTRAQRGRV